MIQAKEIQDGFEFVFDVVKSGYFDADTDLKTLANMAQIALVREIIHPTGQAIPGVEVGLSTSKRVERYLSPLFVFAEGDIATGIITDAVLAADGGAAVEYIHVVKTGETLEKARATKPARSMSRSEAEVQMYSKLFAAKNCNPAYSTHTSGIETWPKTHTKYAITYVSYPTDINFSTKAGSQLPLTLKNSLIFKMCKLASIPTRDEEILKALSIVDQRAGV